jgi:hypothetical protein
MNNRTIEKLNISTCEKYCTLLTFQWNQPKAYNYLIQNKFHQNQGFIIIGTPHLVLSATTSGKENSMESFPVMFDKVREGFWTIPHADPFEILHIHGFALINCPQVFDWIEVWRLRWPWQNIDFVVTEPYLCGS